MDKSESFSTQITGNIFEMTKKNKTKQIIKYHEKLYLKGFSLHIQSEKTYFFFKY